MQYLSHATATAEVRLQVARRHVLALHLVLDGLDWIGRGDAVMPRLIRLDKRDQQVEPVRLRGIRLYVEERLDLLQGLVVVGLVSDGLRPAVIEPVLYEVKASLRDFA
jgi:hypothetical protein